MRRFDYYKPTTFDEAFKLLTGPGKTAMPLAGATDLIPKTRDAVWAPDVVVDVKALPGLREIRVEELVPCCGTAPAACLYVGAAARMSEIARSEVVHSHWDLLAQGAAAMGNAQVRNRATIGGNLCTASPAADTAPALLALEADVQIQGPDGMRCVPITRFFRGPGQTVLRRGEIVVGLLVPRPPEGAVGVFRKLSRRKAGDLSVVSVAALAFPAADDPTRYRWRIALGAVAPTPIRSPQAEAILNQGGLDEERIDEAAAAAYGCCCPIDDVRASAEYRRAMVVNITRRTIKRVLAPVG
jgi:carbon-monoxide dehydrogenase medium subunit